MLRETLCLLLLAVANPGCTESECHAPGVSCTGDSECCANLCGPAGECECLLVNEPCTRDSDCCGVGSYCSPDKLCTQPGNCVGEGVRCDEHPCCGLSRTSCVAGICLCAVSEGQHCSTQADCCLDNGFLCNDQHECRRACQTEGQECGLIAERNCCTGLQCNDRGRCEMPDMSLPDDAALDMSMMPSPPDAATSD